jgi:hypothetical protein
MKSFGLARTPLEPHAWVVFARNIKWLLSLIVLSSYRYGIDAQTDRYRKVCSLRNPHGYSEKMASVQPVDAFIDEHLLNFVPRLNRAAIVCTDVNLLAGFNFPGGSRSFRSALERDMDPPKVDDVLLRPRTGRTRGSHRESFYEGNGGRGGNTFARYDSHLPRS